MINACIFIHVRLNSKGPPGSARGEKRDKLAIRT